MRTLIIDNYDSFTFNLYQLIGQVNGEEPVVVRNDQVRWSELERLGFDNVVLSPGPGTPEREEDIGICRDAILHAEIPLLGVCLGHQGLGLLHGGRVCRAPEPRHGRLSSIHHDGSVLFSGIPQGFVGVRYHSRMVAPELPTCLSRTAWTDDGCVMGLAHRGRPQFGVQFHPESICSEHGDTLLRNFRDLTWRIRRPHPSFAGPERWVAGNDSVTRNGSVNATLSVVPQRRAVESGPARFTVHSRSLPFDATDTSRAFTALFRDEPWCFWLDSSRAEPGLARFSFMGSASGPYAERVAYDQRKQEVTVVSRGRREVRNENLFAYLDRELGRRRTFSNELPFDFNCGFVGYFGFELKVDAGAPSRHAADLPDAGLLFADRMIAFDHEQGTAYLLAFTPDGERAPDAWFQETEHRLRQLPPAEVPPASGAQVTLHLARSLETYLDDIARCQQYIREGESYEICLTNQIHMSAIPDPAGFYLTLRRLNPAPYAAFLRMGDAAVMCSSPERFLRVDRDGRVESKPIKGTRPRAENAAADEQLRRDLVSSEKDRSENLMIVDLLRNDMGLVCELGGVHVPKLMDVETYPTVHQLVSTVRGRLRPGLTAVDCLRAAFPGGSMTGAPKLRTLKIIDELETEPRGIYSGAIGLLAMNGALDLNIVIRTVVATPTKASLGVGGAIVALSNPADEFEETLVKARAVIDALLVSSRGEADPVLRERLLADLRKESHASC